MTDDEILQRIGLADYDVTDLIKKQQSFLDSLNAGQAEAIRRTLPSWKTQRRRSATTAPLTT